ncbi:MAG: NADH-quinone oxidoreductase subunit NuoB [Candidatus Melainabacteria bacterium]|nr:NADH-quinone oxidoreductase subunit NuoB [Candidatus Melainabacteria bacterium]
MLRLLGYLLNQGVVTSKDYCAPLEDGLGLPEFSDRACAGSQCNECRSVCPTGAITVDSGENGGEVHLDLGACIGCSMCVRSCPQETLVNSKKTAVARLSRDDLVISNVDRKVPLSLSRSTESKSLFYRSIACRVVSTGCSACDLEVAACGNSIFDMERFGIHVVASPRFADVLLVTGPVPKAMHDALKSCYEAMAEPRRVIAVGTCATSGGLHRGGYAEANGVDSLLPVDLYIPGCPPHPWSIIDGVKKVMDGRQA